MFFACFCSRLVLEILGKARNGLDRGFVHPFKLNTRKPIQGADVNLVGFLQCPISQLKIGTSN